MAKLISALTRINRQLKKQGRDERLVRGRGGYYYVTGWLVGHANTSIYTNHIAPEHYASTARDVQAMFESAGVTIHFEEI